MPLRLLSATLVADGGVLAQLGAPVAAAPAVGESASQLRCDTGLTADDADLRFAWSRDGRALDGAEGVRAIAPADRGHSFTCAVAATNAWGTSSATSAPHVVGAPASARRLALAGSAAVRGVVRCGAALPSAGCATRAPLAGAHGAQPTSCVAADEGHLLACQTRRADGTLDRSAALRVPRSRGGPALVTP